MLNEVESDHNHRLDLIRLLSGIKSLTESLLSTHSVNVWNTYGSLERVTLQIERVLYHGLRSTQGDFGTQLDFWPFVMGLKVLNPVLTPMLERINRSGNKDKGQHWVRESLRDHILSKYLMTLVKSDERLHKFYFDHAFLCNTEYFTALLTCLKAIEQNNVSLLTELDLTLLTEKAKEETKDNSIDSQSTRKNSATKAVKIRHGHKDPGDLTPAFASPPQHESILATSGEHAIPDFSASPESTKDMARNALRSVLRKSGSESPTGTSTTEDFSFYETLNCDPLGSLDLSRGVFGQDEEPQGEDQSAVKKETTSKGVKPFIQRSQSEVAFHQSRTSEVMEDLFQEKEDFDVKTMNKSVQRPEEIFSDSESSSPSRNVAGLEKTKSKVVKGHKRSRSDQGNINIQKDVNLNTSRNTSLRQDRLRALVPTSPTSDSHYIQPAKGQSLINFLSSHDFQTCATLDKENAHFSISEALIAAIEQMKWNHIISPHRPEDIPEEEDSDEEIQRLQQRIRIRKREKQKEKARGFPAYSDGQTETATSSITVSSPPNSGIEPLFQSDSDSSDADEERIEIIISEDNRENQSNLTRLNSEGLSLSLASLYSDADIQKVSSNTQSSSEQSDLTQLSAESVALSLLKKFSEKQLPKASDLEWLVPETEVPQKLLPLPNCYPVSPDDYETDHSTKKSMPRLRGNKDWAPPRSQIIFNIHSPPKRVLVMAKQNYMCAGCGTRVEPGYIKRFRYCEYLGKFFCQCCHSNQLSYIPARILKKWEFKKYPVSNFSRDLISKIANEPLFDLMDINPGLYRRVRVLDNIRELRQQILYLHKFLKICKFSGSLLMEITSLPTHWYENVHVYSMTDLVSVRGNQMLNQLKNVVTNGLSHVDQCQFCQGFGFICELCKDDRDIIFPFQLEKVQVCPDCKSCFHKVCFVEGKCPKCARLEARRQQLEREASLEVECGS